MQNMNISVFNLIFLLLSPDECPFQYIYLPELYSCYRIVYKNMNWDEAASFCQQFGGYVVSLDTMREYDIFISWIKAGNIVVMRALIAVTYFILSVVRVIPFCHKSFGMCISFVSNTISIYGYFSVQRSLKFMDIC